MQQAYFSESTAAGGWTIIGYTAPNNGETNNFKYAGELEANATNTAPSGVIGWFAGNKNVLNGCAAVANPTKGTAPWKVSVTKATTGTADLTFTATVAGDGCKVLTASFEQIGQ